MSLVNSFKSLKVKVGHFFETPGRNNPTTQCHTPVEFLLPKLRCGSLKSILSYCYDFVYLFMIILCTLFVVSSE
jgi:hypothetical protein